MTVSVTKSNQIPYFFLRKTNQIDIFSTNWKLGKLNLTNVLYFFVFNQNDNLENS